MKITNFAKMLEACLPTDWVLWAGGSAAQYNYERNAQDTVALIIPRWEAEWKDGCTKDIRVEFRLFKYTDIVSTGAYQQHIPYNGLELFDAMITTANEFLTNVNNHKSMQVLEVSPYDFLDTPAGATVNAQAQVSFSAKLRIVPEAEELDHIPFLHD